jgi:hypothetical protein
MIEGEAKVKGMAKGENSTSTFALFYIDFSIDTASYFGPNMRTHPVVEYKTVL